MVIATEKAETISEWSEIVRERDGWKCLICGTTEKKYLIAHHKDTADNMKFIVANGQTLCRSCHRKGHWKPPRNHEQKTNIQILVKTKVALKSLGKMADTYDDVIQRLINGQR